MSAARLPAEQAAWARVAAELVNTAPRETDPPEKLLGVSDLERLLSLCPEPAPAASDLSAVRSVRGQLLVAFHAAGEGEGEFAAAVNPLLGTPWALARGPGGWALAPASSDDVASWLGARAARGLAELVLAYGLDRVHLCSAGDCLRAVADTSRNGNRRYCSRTCANRVNSRRFRAAR
jgi:predicted RNA-binding Zn ribbon-like protein